MNNKVLYFGGETAINITAEKHIIILGRGHSGTRIIAEVIANAGAYTGKTNGPYFDHVPPHFMYNAAQLYGYFVKPVNGGWDFSEANAMTPPRAYLHLLRRYLDDFIDCDEAVISWKLPEAILAAPWLTQIFPDAYYIYWIRDGRDNILQWHQTDELEVFSLPIEPHESRLYNAARSWVYQSALIDAMPKPRHWLALRFKDYVNDQPAALTKLRDYLGLDAQPIPVYPERLDRWRAASLPEDVLAILAPTLERHNYELG